MDFEALSTKDVAYHMTLFDWDLFWAVHEYELLYHTFGRHHFNKVRLHYLLIKLFYSTTSPNPIVVGYHFSNSFR